MRNDIFPLPIPSGVGSAFVRDSRERPLDEFKGLFSWVVTSPPYYGMRTYLQDQWLRNWFLGGSSFVDYSSREGIRFRALVTRVLFQTAE